MSVLELSGIERSYQRGTPVLSGIDLRLGAGEVLGLLGENGAGKTTLIKIALGTLLPQAGEIRLFGLDPRQHPVEVKQRLGYVSEDLNLPHYLRVREVLSLHRSLFPSWDDGLERDLCERFEINGKARIDKLSRGQARRVSVLCAIAHRPELLLLDEPAAGFDPAARREFLEAALQLLSEEGSAILFSSHYMQDLERIAGRVALLQGGTLLFDRELDELREDTTLVVLPLYNGLSCADVMSVAGCLGARVVEDELRAVFEGGPDQVRTRLMPFSCAHAPSCTSVTLEDLFVEIAEGRQ